MTEELMHELMVAMEENHDEEELLMVQEPLVIELLKGKNKQHELLVISKAGKAGRTSELANQLDGDIIVTQQV